MIETRSLQYPIGKLTLSRTLSKPDRIRAIETIADLPEKLLRSLDGLSSSNLEHPYRPGGWTIKQLVHHIADSDMTAYSWMRLALTSDWPTVYAYEPASLAELADSSLPAPVSLQLLVSLHQRWVHTLRAVSESDWETRGYIHPESGRCTLAQALVMYAWHSRHHLAHIQDWRARNGL